MIHKAFHEIGMDHVDGSVCCEIESSPFEFVCGVLVGLLVAFLFL